MRLDHLSPGECLTIPEMIRPFETDPAQADAFRLLGDAHQRAVRAWLDALSPVVEGPRAGRGRRLAAAAARMGVPVRTARNRFDDLQREGWRGLLDKRQRAAAAKMSDLDCADLRAFSEWLKGLAENYAGNLRQARRAAIALWKTGKDIPGYAARPAPGLNGLPVGWSYPNIARLARLTTYERKVSAIGRAAARCHAPMVVRTRVGMRPGQVYMVDDLWHDVECHLLGSQRQFVRPMELACIDVFSAAKIAYGLKPRIKDESTGRRINLRATDMRFLLAHLVCNVGFDPEQCLIIAEHGTASVEGPLADLLKERSQGAIRIVTGGIEDRPAILGAWGGRKGGNPRLKAAIESAHRLPHFAAKWLPGQTGGDSRNNLPEDHHGREGYFKEVVNAVATALQGMDPDRARWFLNEFQAPVWSYFAVSKFIDELYLVIDSRTEHELEGWEQEGLVVSGFRTALSAEEFFPYSGIAQLPADQAAAVRQLLSVSPHLNVSRRLSPIEVWNSGRRRLRRLPPEAFAEICGRDLAVERRVRDHQIRFEDSGIERGRKFAFPAVAVDPRGHEILLKDGESYLTVLNPFDPSRLFVLDARFAYIGVLSAQIVVSHAADMQKVHAAMGQASHAEAIAMLPYRMRHADREGEAGRMRDHNARLLSGALVPPEEQAVKYRAAASAKEGDMAALLSACPAPADEEPPEDPAPDLSTIFGPTPGSQE